MAEPKPTLHPETETEFSQDQTPEQQADLPPDADPYLALEAELDATRTERDEMRDRMMRALAEAENSRKRAEKDRRDAQLYGGSKIARDILPVYDNLSRALNAVTDETRSAAGGLVEGVELTLRELTNVMQKHGVERISPEVGDMFDPHAHQAMFEAPVPDFKAGQIIQVMADGFKLYDQLLRPAHVGVSSTPAG
ncbi:nucleotide exchange factor GrpE [Roseinatronobacter sp.]|uniref:nucleotide exchange factor GrpE n=1 Tax=Roseinatronobacter sp. TaxID=1945755 RepID=UPI003F727A4F